MTQVLLIQRGSNPLMIATPAIADLNKVVERSTQPGDNYTWVDSSILPTDGYFREAWRLSSQTNEFEIDMIAAIDTHTAQVYKKRDARIKELEQYQLRYGNDAAKMTDVYALKDLLYTLSGVFGDPTGTLQELKENIPVIITQRFIWET